MHFMTKRGLVSLWCCFWQFAASAAAAGSSSWVFKVPPRDLSLYQELEVNYDASASEIRKVNMKNKVQSQFSAFATRRADCSLMVKPALLAPPGVLSIGSIVSS
jgi:hypothetical protein